MPLFGDHVFTAILLYVSKSRGEVSSKNVPAQTSDPAVLRNSAALAVVFTPDTSGLAIMASSFGQPEKVSF